jgi:hypothetical protein
MNGICSETHEDSCLSSKHKTKLFDDSRRAVREREEGRKIAEVEIVCVPGRSKCDAVPGFRERDRSEVSRKVAPVSRMDPEEKVT